VANVSVDTRAISPNPGANHHLVINEVRAVGMTQQEIRAVHVLVLIGAIGNGTSHTFMLGSYWGMRPDG